LRHRGHCDLHQTRRRANRLDDACDVHDGFCRWQRRRLGRRWGLWSRLWSDLRNRRGKRLFGGRRCGRFGNWLGHWFGHRFRRKVRHGRGFFRGCRRSCFLHWQSCCLRCDFGCRLHSKLYSSLYRYLDGCFDRHFSDWLGRLLGCCRALGKRSSLRSRLIHCCLGFDGYGFGGRGRLFGGGFHGSSPWGANGLGIC